MRLWPRVDALGRVTFQLRAPEAAEALVVIESEEPAAMSRDATGIWSLTTEPLPPDLYAYFLVADGLPRSDAANPLGKPIVTGGVQSAAALPTVEAGRQVGKRRGAGRLAG